MLNEDWEHDAQKDFIYLHELQMDIEREYYEWLERQPAKIVIINPEKIENNEEHTISSVSTNT